MRASVSQRSFIPLFLWALIFTTMMPVILSANIVLPSVFGDNMVLQQNAEVVFWGWAKPLEPVSIEVSWQNEVIETFGDNQAKWQVKVNTPLAGGPHTIRFKGYNEITLRNVMIGEVWLCSGQSNMEWTARMGILNAQQEVENASFPNIRFLNVDHRTAATQQVDISTSGWQECTPTTMQDFSAVAYFFARRLQEKIDVPIGLINSSWGGTPAEAWTGMDFCEDPDLVNEAGSMLPDTPWGPEEAGSIFNAMVAPLIQFRIAGALWYQGEANTPNANFYEQVFTNMIKSWRKAWGYAFPFYYAQIAPYKFYDQDSGVRIRDAQRRALSIPETGMVVTSDIGNIDDIHPLNKQDVGFRLATLALNRVYHIEDVIDSGPLYQGHEIHKNKVTVFFNYEEGLYFKRDVTTDFEIAGADGKFYSANALIESNTIVLSSPHVQEPIAVRYAWADATEPTLFNGANLPASSFRTDDWEN